MLADNMTSGDLYGISFSVGNKNMTDSIALDESYTVGEFTYIFKQIDQSVALKVYGPSCMEKLTWAPVDAAKHYIIEFSFSNDSASSLKIQTDSNGIDTYAFPTEICQWQAKTLEEEVIESGQLISVFDANKSWEIISEANGITDVFFAKSNGNWDSSYCAVHQGVNDWMGTGELLFFANQNKIIDIYKGSDDANVLLLTDDTCGDALFLDDVFSDRGNQARLARIDQIYAGNGDDIIDLTSRQFEYSGDGIWIYGGNGDDVIWANNGSNILFGDAGNDRIVGGTGDDIITGGSGDDSLHGGGGNDIFVFGDNWGCDTVEQRAGAAITLWFESNTGFWNEDTRTYTCDSNSVTVNSTATVILKFGNDGSEQYNELAAHNAFRDAVSAKIFEDKDTGFLA